MIIRSFPKIVKEVLATLPRNDYPVLNTRLFVECWLGYALDKSLTSMRDLFKRLNNTGIEVDISTFSKASSHRSKQIFQQIYQQLSGLIYRKNMHDKYTICPIDSTTISLTSKLLWSLGYHQVKLFSSLNLQTGAIEENLVVFGFNHDYKYGKDMINSLPEKAVGVMDRGKAWLKILAKCCWLKTCILFYELEINTSWNLLTNQNRFWWEQERKKDSIELYNSVTWKRKQSID